MKNSWKKEAEYQATKLLLVSMKENGLLTKQEYTLALRKIKQRTKPPITELAS